MDNPAGRLRYWISEIDQLQKDQAIGVEVARKIGVDPNTIQGRFAVMRFGAELAELCAEVRQEVAQLPDYLHAHIPLGDFVQIEKAVDFFTMARQQTVQKLMSAIDPAGHRSLEILDAHLHTQRAQPLIPDEKRQSLTDQVEALIADLRDADDLDDEAKDFILAKLADVEAALRNAMVTGTAAIEKATDSLIGGVRRRPDVWERVAKTKWGPRLGKIAAALCLALGALPGALELMPGPEQEQSSVVMIDVEDNDTIVVVNDDDVDDVAEVVPD